MATAENRAQFQSIAELAAALRNNHVTGSNRKWLDMIDGAVTGTDDGDKPKDRLSRIVAAATNIERTAKNKDLLDSLLGAAGAYDEIAAHHVSRQVVRGKSVATGS